MSPLQRGYIHVYTGDGKGKTTAALGLALRIRREDVTDLDRQEAHHALYHARQAMAESDWDVLILDEILVANWFGLVSVQEILGLMESKPPTMELILTGRRAPVEVIQKADLATEMLEIKHYYKLGVQARRGIES
jgi:cob(I)alamin adenosyltransferase